MGHSRRRCRSDGRKASSLWSIALWSRQAHIRAMGRRRVPHVAVAVCEGKSKRQPEPWKDLCPDLIRCGAGGGGHEARIQEGDVKAIRGKQDPRAEIKSAFAGTIAVDGWSKAMSLIFQRSSNDLQTHFQRLPTGCVFQPPITPMALEHALGWKAGSTAGPKMEGIETDHGMCFRPLPPGGSAQRPHLRRTTDWDNRTWAVVSSHSFRRWLHDTATRRRGGDDGSRVGEYRAPQNH